MGIVIAKKIKTNRRVGPLGHECRHGHQLVGHVLGGEAEGPRIGDLPQDAICLDRVVDDLDLVALVFPLEALKTDLLRIGFRDDD